VARELCKRLGYLPLGLELVGRYLLGDEELSLAEMLQDLEKERLKNPALEEAQPEMTAKLGVAAAFELSWRRLRENAQNLGCLLSLFAQAPIPWELVEGITINNEAQNWKQARRELLQLHLLQYKDEGVYQLHPLLREFFKDKLTGLEQAEEFKRSFCGVMVGVAQGIPETLTLQQIKHFAPAIAHLAEVANHLIEYVNDDDLIYPFMGNATFYMGGGLYDQAELWLEQSLEATKKRLGEEHLHVAESLNNLAEICRLQGKYKEAELRLKEVIELDKRFQRQEDPEFAQSLNNLAMIYGYQELYAEAENLHRQALALKLCLLGYENLSVAKSLNNLAEIYRLQVRYTEAEALYRQALTLFQHLGRQEHPAVAKILNNLALVSKSQGKYSDAESLNQQALELKRRLHGEAHPDVAISLLNQAKIYELQERYSEAESLYILALDIFERRLGVNNTNTVGCRQNLADLRGRRSPP
jgi:tetratricopeptide (TPR) repeat protein